jgi:hypothetical protein
LVGGIALLAFTALNPVAGIVLIAGGVVAAGSAYWTRDAMNESYKSKNKYSDSEERLKKMIKIVQEARKKLEIQKRRLEEMTFRL